MLIDKAISVTFNIISLLVSKMSTFSLQRGLYSQVANVKFKINYHIQAWYLCLTLLLSWDDLNGHASIWLISQKLLVWSEMLTTMRCYHVNVSTSSVRSFSIWNVLSKLVKIPSSVGLPLFLFRVCSFLGLAIYKCTTIATILTALYKL